MVKRLGPTLVVPSSGRPVAGPAHTAGPPLEGVTARSLVALAVGEEPLELGGQFVRRRQVGGFRDEVLPVVRGRDGVVLVLKALDLRGELPSPVADLPVDLGGDQLGL